MFQRVGGSSMGGGAFIGLGNLLTNAQSFDELLLMAEKGDHRKCDTLVGHNHRPVLLLASALVFRSAIYTADPMKI